ncbi:MAG: hypothetical protein JSW52_07005 [Candidatus Coatesbacteria bacterium]|nr:MAG: hypothetical protein JSW52_07005 [Candidatus Coatesbacteria bacterium]
MKNGLMIKITKLTAFIFAFIMFWSLYLPATAQEAVPDPDETAGEETETVETETPETDIGPEILPETGEPEEGDVEIDIELGEGEEDEGMFEGEFDEDDLVAIGNDIYVAEDEEVLGDAVCIQGDLTIAGMVRGDAVCFGGDIILESSAVVYGDAVSFGGCIDAAPGAEIGGQKVCIGGEFPPFVPFIKKFVEISEPIASNVIDIVWEIAFFLFLMFLGLLASVFMKRQMDNVRDHLTDEFPRSALLGIAMAVLAPIALVILAFSVIGWPLIPLFIIALLALQYFGYVVFGETLGGVILGAEKHPMLKILVGVAILQSVAFIGDLIAIPAGIFGDIGGVFGSVGTIIFLTCGVLGAGGILYSRLGLWPLEKTREWHEARANNRKGKTAE